MIFYDMLDLPCAHVRPYVSLLYLALGMAAENAVAFGVNEALKRAFPDDPASKLDPNKPPDLVKPFAMGTLTGCCSAMVLLPSEIVKVWSQTAVCRLTSY